MEKCFLTNGGNLLRFHPTEKFYFQKPNGEFIREVSDSEAEYLCQNCLEVDVHFPNEHPQFLPTWNFVRSVLVTQDNSDYKWEACRNGGNYAFQTYHDWYVAQYPDGSWKFAFVERYSTSAELAYDELTGLFQSNLGCLNISNIMGEPASYQCQQAKWWDEEEVRYYREEVLEKIATVSSFEHLWNEMFEFIPSRWDEDEDELENEIENEIEKALSFSEKKEILIFLKGLGITKEEKTSRRPQRRNARR